VARISAKSGYRRRVTRSLPRSFVLVAALTVGVTALAPLPAGATVAPGGTVTPAALAPAALSPESLAAQTRMAALLPPRVAAAKALGTSRTGLVADLESGTAIWQAGASTAMRGASTTKLATAITALRLLGTSTRFPTRVVTGRTSTEVVLVGGGDPSLTSGQLSTLARATAVALLAELAPAATTTPPPSVDGVASPTPVRRPAPRALRITVRLDDTLYPAPTAAAGWTSSYQPYVVRPVRPLVRDHRVGWDVAKDAAGYFSSRVSAELAALTATRTDVRASASYAGRLARPAAATEIARFAGNTSRTALARMLLISDNDIAEMLFRDNAIASGRSGSWADASRTEVAELLALGIPITGWALYDGSGVSRSDRVSAAGLVAILRAAQAPEHPELWPLKALLPVAAVSGTLQHRFTALPTSCAARKVFAKTGTLFDTIGLAGYSLGSDNRLRAFAVLVHKTSSTYTQTAVRRAVEIVPATATGCY
jgi:D-alanyl-D-alanine carboxypeptidase/D-alanyl-D-alanine-endopeptidase (penicillin-binding protein 4)